MNHKPLLLTLALLGTLISFSPQVGAAHFASAQLTAEVHADAPTIDFTFTQSQQDTLGSPSFTYFLYSGVSGRTNEGDVTTLDNYTVNGNVITFSWDDPSPGFDSYWIVADDGAHSLDGCFVDLDTTSLGSTASCTQNIGLRGFITRETDYPGTDDLEFRFNWPTQDPSGALTYSLWTGQDFTSYVELVADVSTLDEYSNSNGLIAFALNGLGGVESNMTYLITANSNSIQSCPITLNRTTTDFNVCGIMETEWEEYYCILRGENGFSHLERVSIDFDTESLTFSPNVGFFTTKPAVAAVTLPGTSQSYRFNFTIQADSDGVSSHFNIFFSEIPIEASATSTPANNLKSRPNDNAFADGYGVFFLEDGGDWHTSFYRNQNGTVTVLAAQFFSANPNDKTNGTLDFDPWQDTITLQLGSQTTRLDFNDEAPGEDTFHSFWLMETGGELVLLSLTDAETTLYFDQDDNLCLFTATQGQYGTVESIAGGQSQGLPQFTGEGGYLEEPSFPGINLNQTATVLGIDLTVLGFIMAAVLVIICIVAFGPVMGGGIGGAIAAGLATALGLIPAWLLVVLFLGLAALVVLGNRNGSGV